MADVILLSKVDPEKNLESAKELAEDLNLGPSVPVLYGGSSIKPEATLENGKPMSEEEAAKLIKGKKVLVIDDGPTLTHGGTYEDCLR